MRAALIEELEVPGEARPDVGDGVIAVQVDLLVLHGAPEAFDEDVVSPAALAVHADVDLPASEDVQELETRELAPLVGVEDLGTAEPSERLLERRDAEVTGERRGQRARSGPCGSPSP